MDIERRVPWREVEPLPDLNGTIEPLLKTVSILRDAWEDALCGASPEDVLAVRERRLRHHAIETGIIERLSVTTIRRLHQLITRHQPAYEARDNLGGIVKTCG